MKNVRILKGEVGYKWLRYLKEGVRFFDGHTTRQNIRIRKTTNHAELLSSSVSHNLSVE